MPKITAVICTYNRYDLLPKAIESLKNQSLPQDQYKIIVIDNSPDFEYAQKVKQEYEQLPLLEYVIEKIPGLSNARNVAAKMCGTEFIAYMDDDAIASPDWLKNIVETFEQFGSEAAVLGGKVDPIWEIERPDWLADDLLCYVSVVNWGGETRVAEENEWFAGTNISFRTQEILENGAFNVSLGRNGSGSILLSNEETDLLNRIKAKGKLTIYAPEAAVSHLVEKQRLQRTWFRKRVAWQAISNCMMDSNSNLSSATEGWHFVFNYLFSLPPRERTVRGLFYETDDPKLFQEQLWVLSSFTGMLLAGFEGVEK